MTLALVMPRAAWPAADRLAWDRATSPPASLFDPGQLAARLRPRTLHLYESTFGLWLEFLRRQGWLAKTGMAVTAERLDGFIAHQRARGNNNGTVAKRLANLHATLRLMAPEQDFSFILRPNGIPLSRALPNDPAPISTVDSRILFGKVRELHRAGLAGESYGAGLTALRDAAVLGVLVTLAPRVGSLAVMELGRHLLEEESGYRLWFGGHDTKNKRSLTYLAGPALTSILSDYLKLARPLMGGTETSMVWLGMRENALNVGGLAKIARRRMTEWFGKDHGPHWFRKCLTTTAVMEAPDTALAAAAVLGHSPQVSLKHYNQANASAALKRHGDHIAKLRWDTQGLAERALAGQRNRLPSVRQKIGGQDS